MRLPEAVVGVLLAGGKSSRMGGGDKCLLPLAGAPMLTHVVRRLRPQVSELILNANGDFARFAAFGLPIVGDRIGDHAGPLAGIHAALEWAIANRPESRFVITAATDTPFFPTDLVARFLASLAEGEPKLMVARSEEGVHPIFGLWPVSLVPELEKSLTNGMRKVQAWVREHQAQEIFFPSMEIGGRKIDPFFNVNRPDDLTGAEAILYIDATRPPVFGIAGWKNSGKTTLAARLVAELTERGYAVTAIKHAHESFDIDQPGRDSYRLREAGARRVILSSPKRWALIHELGSSQELPFEDLLSQTGPCDLVLVEGFKREAFPKIEIRRGGATSQLPLTSSPDIVAVASDRPDHETDPLPIFHLDDIPGIADFIARHSGLPLR
jgi:molybdenum cofactor guanylyltransferase/molybdopterin-guanine dinucleotide biosynthesis protein MobB